MSETLNIFAHTDTRYSAADVVAFEARVASGEFGKFRPCVLGQRVTTEIEGLRDGSGSRIGVPSSCCYFGLGGYSMKLTAVERFIAELEDLFGKGIGDDLGWDVRLKVEHDGNVAGVVTIGGQGSVDSATIYALGKFAALERPVFDILNLHVGGSIRGARVEVGEKKHARRVVGPGGVGKFWSVVMDSPLNQMVVRSSLSLSAGWLDKEEILDGKLISGCLRFVDSGVFPEGANLRVDTLVEESLQDWLNGREGDGSSSYFEIGRLDIEGGEAVLHVKHEEGAFGFIAFASDVDGDTGPGIFRLFEEYGFES